MPLRPSRRSLVSGFAVMGALPTVARADERQVAPTDPIRFVTEHRGVFNGQRVAYTATVEETLTPAAEGLPACRIVATAYVRSPVDAARPVIFLFNGGPISASSYLHIGGFGPKRYDPPTDVDAAVPEPYALVDNTESLLDVADIVFFDPPETGFSRVVDPAQVAQTYSDAGDSRAACAFVETWLKAKGREASPRYVLGESYGTLRAALMAGRLSETLPLDGVLLMGQALNMIETSQRPGNVVSFATNLPALTAVAAYHGRIALAGRTVSDLIEEAWTFGMGEYLNALRQGSRLPYARRSAIAARLEALTGISTAYYLEHRLKISKEDFVVELLRDRGEMLGMYDARYRGPAPAPGERPKDPYGKVNAMVAPLLQRHMTENLKVTLPMDEYRGAAPRIGPWRYGPSAGAGGPFDDYNYDAGIARAMAANPRFRLLIGTGIYDTTTTLGPARYLVDQASYPADRVALKQYDGGHMAYSNPEARAAMAADIRAFVTGRA